jgi:hypothetical protein
MTTSVILSAVFSVLIIACLAGVCSAAYLVASGAFDRRVSEELSQPEEELFAA